MPISVNMFGLRLTSEVQKRWKNGQPPQSTTGVASANSIQESEPLFGCCLCTRGRPSCGTCRAGCRGTVSARLTQKRRVMSRSSGFSSADAVTVRGSRAMPQIGHAPGAGPDDLGMHGAGVFGARGGERNIWFERHAAGRTSSGLGLADLGAHGADVGWASGWRLPCGLGFEWAESMAREWS